LSRKAIKELGRVMMEEIAKTAIADEGGLMASIFTIKKEDRELLLEISEVISVLGKVSLIQQVRPSKFLYEHYVKSYLKI
jgi:hypothetical protein